MASNNNTCSDQKCSFQPWISHSHRKHQNGGKVLPNIMCTTGNTPMVKLNKIPKEAGLKCDVYAKLEFFNPAGSIKDRIILRMIEDAEEQGRLKPGCTIVEPSSGNTGIALSMACAIKGYKCLVVMPEKISQDKESTIKLLGGQVIRTPNGKPHYDPESVFQVASRLSTEIPNAVMLNQFTNPLNPLTHYDETAEEILGQCGEQVDMVVIGTGTGGSITGISWKIKERQPNCQVIGVDPEGSLLALPESINKTDVKLWEVEGIGYTFVSDVLHRQHVDRWIKTNDKTSMTMARKLCREEGILAGESSGATLSAALIAAKDLKEGQKCVVIMADGIRNYMTKFVTENWLEGRGHKEVVNEHNHWWWNRTVADLALPAIKAINSTTTCQEALKFLKSNGFDRAPVENNEGSLVGILSLKHLTNKVVSQNYQLNIAIGKAAFTKFRRVKKDTILGLVSRILEIDEFVAIMDEADRCIGIISHLDLLHFVATANAINAM